MKSNTKMEKRSPPAEAERHALPKLGNVTTGLQGDALNRLENLTVPIYRRNVDSIKSLILLSKLWHKKIKDLLKIIKFS